MALQFAVASEDFGRDLRRSIAAASRTRVSGVRLNARTEIPADQFSETALRQLSLYLQEHRLRTAGLMFSTRHALHDPRHLPQRLDGIRTAMPLARRLGTAEMIVRCGRIPDPRGTDSTAPAGTPTNSSVDSLKNPLAFAPQSGTASGPTDAQQFELLAELLNDLARYGNRVGCTLQLQLSAYQPDRVQELLGRVKDGPVGIVFDPATCVMTGSDPVSTYRDLYRTVGYIRARDAVRDVDGAGVEVAVGDGVVEWLELLPTLAEADYSGWVCIERTGGEDRVADVQSGVARLQRLIPGASLS